MARSPASSFSAAWCRRRVTRSAPNSFASARQYVAATAPATAPIKNPSIWTSSPSRQCASGTSMQRASSSGTSADRAARGGTHPVWRHRWAGQTRLATCGMPTVVRCGHLRWDCGPVTAPAGIHPPGAWHRLRRYAIEMPLILGSEMSLGSLAYPLHPVEGIVLAVAHAGRGQQEATAQARCRASPAPLDRIAGFRPP